jgi:hypothetical protein
MVWRLLAQSFNECNGTKVCETGLPRIEAGPDQLQIIANVAFGVIGVIAVFLIMLNGYKLIISNGDPQALGKARSTLIFAVVGLVVAVSADLIINLVIGRITK